MRDTSPRLMHADLPPSTTTRGKPRLWGRLLKVLAAILLGVASMEASGILYSKVIRGVGYWGG